MVCACGMLLFVDAGFWFWFDIIILIVLLLSLCDYMPCSIIIIAALCCFRALGVCLVYCRLLVCWIGLVFWFSGGYLLAC